MRGGVVAETDSETDREFTDWNALSRFIDAFLEEAGAR